MSNMLDRRFFERCKCTSHKGLLFESYKAVYARSTMVLFSRKTRTPLAALTLSTRDVGCLSMFTGRPSPSGSEEPYFQGMLNMPDQAFTFSISNLSERGMINFNILHTPHRVSCVDPGPAYGINQVNELHTNQSYTVTADQRNSRQMVLAGKTKTVQKKQVAVSVQETETSDKNKGLYFYLSVVPDKSCKPLVDEFAEGTAWKVVPGFVRRVAQPQPPPPPVYYRHGNGQRRARGIPRSFLTPPGHVFAAAAPPPPPFPGHGFAPPPPPLGAVPSQPLDAPGAGYSQARRSAGSPDFQQAQQQPRPFYHGPVESAGAAPTVPAISLSASSAPRSSFFGSMRNMLGGGSGASRSPAPARNAGSYSTALRSSETDEEEEDAFYSSVQRHAKPVDVGSTQAGTLSYGEHVDIVSNYTGHDYAYEHASEPTVLCMSIWEDMKFLSLAETIEQELEAEVKEWIENEGKALIESLNAVYKSETCVIDLESEADTIICTCGHQCINHANVSQLLEAQHHRNRKCPMCRGPITAFVKADGMLVE